METSIHKNHRKRMREKYEKHGADVFDTHQLLEMLLFHGVRQSDTNPTAHKLLAKHPNGPLGAAGGDELCDVEGIGANCANLLSISSDTTVRLLCDMIAEKPLSSEFSREMFLWLWFRNKSERCAAALLLDEKNRYVDCVLLAKGRTFRAMDYAEMLVDVMKTAGAKRAVVCHNHANNDPRPSIDDMCLTTYIEKMLNDEGLCLLAHYMVTDSDCVKCYEE